MSVYSADNALERESLARRLGVHLACILIRHVTLLNKTALVANARPTNPLETTRELLALTRDIHR